MAYYVDTCDGRLFECDSLAEAREHLAAARQSAREFETRMGFLPFWFNAVEIRKGPRVNPGYGLNGEVWNQRVVAATKKVG